MLLNNQLFAIFILIGFIACQAPSTNDSPSDQLVAPKAVDEDQLTQKIIPLLEANPQTNYQKERNALLNFALDKKIDFQETKNGLLYQIVDKGGEPKGKWGKKVAVYYKGYFTDGQIFDQKLAPEAPLDTYIGNTIHAWNQGLEMIGPGGKIILLAPSHLAYGEEGAGNGRIPANTPLVFEVQFVDFIAKKAK